MRSVSGDQSGLRCSQIGWPSPDDVLVAVDHVEVGLRRDLLGDSFEGVGGEGVVVVEQGDVLAGGEFERGVGGGGDPAGAVASFEVDARV